MESIKRIKVACSYAGISQADLARALCMSPQSFSKRLKTDRFSPAEWCRIADALGAEFHSAIIFPDGFIVE